MQRGHFLLEFLHQSLQSGIFDSFGVVVLSELVLFVSCLFLELLGLGLKLLDLFVELVTLLMPLSCFLFLTLEPFIILILGLLEFLFCFFHVPLVKTQHFLDLCVKSLDLLVLVVDFVFQVPLLSHNLFLSQMSLLQHLIMANMGERCLGGVPFQLLIPLSDHILKLFLDAVMGDRNLGQPQFVIFSEVQSVLHFMGQSLPGLLQQLAK